MPSGGENTYGRTQNLYVLRDLARHSCSQHNSISKECLIHSCCQKKLSTGTKEAGCLDKLCSGCSCSAVMPENTR